MKSQLLVAKRYAQAFLNLFALTIEDLNRIEQAIGFLEQHTQVFSLLKVPLLDANIKINALDEYLIGRFKLPDSFKKLIRLLVAQKRSFLIIDVLKELHILYQDRHGMESFTIASSAPLENNDVKKIHDFLADHTHHNIVCVPMHDAQLIGGIRMQSANHLWEYSIRKQLAAIQAQSGE